MFLVITSAGLGNVVSKSLGSVTDLQESQCAEEFDSGGKKRLRESIVLDREQVKHFCGEGLVLRCGEFRISLCLSGWVSSLAAFTLFRRMSTV